MKTLLIYKSETGFTKAYADMIKARIHDLTVVDLKHFKRKMVKENDIIFYGGPLRNNVIVGLNKFLKTNDDWVIDGNYYEIAPERYELCDEIYYLDFPRLFCLKEAVKRYLKNRNQFRESLGCIESFDFSFFLWIIYEGRTKYWRNKHLEHLKMAKVRHHFKSRKELNSYLIKKGIM